MLNHASTTARLLSSRPSAGSSHRDHAYMAAYCSYPTKRRSQYRAQHVASACALHTPDRCLLANPIGAEASSMAGSRGDGSNS